jgi:two-component system cell cycle sensor histidine kinase/response regulator CckA
MNGAQPCHATQDLGTVLVVDDSTVICEVIRQVLQPVGYRVLWARDPFVALQTCRQHPGPIDLLVTDIMMPGMDGRQLADSVVETRPDTRVLFMSGVVPWKELPPGCAFLPKPYGHLDLLQKVEEALTC